MRFGFPILMVGTGALVAAGGCALAAATTGTGTPGARPVAFAVPAEPAQVITVGRASAAPTPLGVAPVASGPAARTVLRTRSDAGPASWRIRASGPPAATR